MTILRRPWWLIALAACNCDPTALPPSVGRDAASPLDATATDARATDAAAPDADAGAADSGLADTGPGDAGPPPAVEVNAIAPTFGARSGGTAVTVLGRGFVDGRTEVTIDGAPLTDVVVLDRGVLRGVTSAFSKDGAAAVQVTVAGASGTLSGAFLVEGWAYANGGLPRGFAADLIVVDPNDADVIYMIDDRRPIKSIDGGLTWFPANWSVPSPNASSLIVDAARPGRLSMDTKTEVWVSENAGASWVRTGAGRLQQYHRPLVADGAHADVQLIVRDQPIGTYNGLLDLTRTPDFWRTAMPCAAGGLSLAAFPTVEAVQIALDDETVLASLNGVLYRSLPPGCDHWTRADAGLVGVASIIERAPGSPTFFALTSDGLYAAPGPAAPGPAAPWTRVADAPPDAPTRMLVAGTTPPRIYVGAAGRSPTSWMTTTPSAAWAPLVMPTAGALGIDPRSPSTLYAAGPEGAFRSDDDGVSWRLLTATPHSGGADVLAVSPRIATQVLAAVGPYIYRSLDGGDAWQRTSAALGGQSVLSLVYAPRTSSIAYASSGLAVLRTGDGGATWTDIKPAHAPRGGILAVSPSAPERLYLANGELLRTDDGGRRWTTLGSPRDAVYDLHVDARLPDTLYAVLSSSGVARTDDGGMSWVDASSGLPAGRYVSVLVADPTLSGVLYAGVSRPTVGHDFFKSLDGGQRWSSIPVGTRDIPTTIAIDPNDSEQVYVGAGFEVLKSDDGGARWRPLNPEGKAGHAPAQVALGLITDLALAPSDPGTFYVSGRGIGAAVLRSTER